MPDGWVGGIRTVDAYSSGTIAAGPDGKAINSYMNRNGDIFARNSIISDGKIWCKGGAAGGGGGTHFPYDNGVNYIRGHTQHDGNFNINGTLNAGAINASSIRFGDWVIYNVPGDQGGSLRFQKDGVRYYQMFGGSNRFLGS